MLTKDELLEPLSALRTDEVVVTTMGMVRPWARYSQSALDFASADSAMGHAADLAVGIALAQPDRRVVCINGDGSMLMTLGTLVTAAALGASNLILFVVQNGSYEITGNQPTPGGAAVDFALMARAAGFPAVHAFEDAGAYRQALSGILRAAGPVLISAKVAQGIEGPLRRGSDDEPPYLRPSLADSASALRRALARREPGGG